MRARILAIGVLFACAATLVRAQTGTGDGFDAFVRGDYQRAAEILKPIAEKSPQPEYAAKFLMGTMYENGLGVAADRMRACALYMSAADPRGTTPFAVAAGTLLRTMHETMTREEFEDCELLASLGFDHGFEPATFALEPGDWISWDLKGATIRHNGQDTRSDRLLGSGRTVFLPLQHVALAVGRPGAARRHFIELAAWVAARDRQTWSLTWKLYEVVRDELIDIAGESLVATISAQEPPTAPPFDVHELAGVRVNASGDAEWAVLAGPRQRTELIDSDEVRQEEKQQKLAQAAAEARVDWAAEPDVRRAPALAYADGAGCGNAFLYGWSANRTEAIAVRADKDLLQLSTKARSFDLAAVQAGLEVAAHVYERPLRSWPFCTDLGSAMRPEVWRAVRGTVTIELSAPGIRIRQPHLYRATVHITGAEFVNGSGQRVSQTRPITLTAIVGNLFE